MSFNNYLLFPDVGGQEHGENLRPQGQPYSSTDEAGRVVAAGGPDSRAPQRQVSEGSFDFSPSATSRSSIADVPAVESSKTSRARHTGPPGHWLNREDPWEEAAAGLHSLRLPPDVSFMASSVRSVESASSYTPPTDVGEGAPLDALASQILPDSQTHAEGVYRQSTGAYRLAENTSRDRRDSQRRAALDEENTLYRSESSSGRRTTGGASSYSAREGSANSRAGAERATAYAELSGNFVAGSRGGVRNSAEDRRAATRRSDDAAFHAEMLDPMNRQGASGSTQYRTNLLDATYRREEDCESPYFSKGRALQYQAATPRVVGKAFFSLQHAGAAAAAAEDGEDVYVMAAENDEDGGLNPDLTEEAGGYWPPQFHGDGGGGGRSRIFGGGGGTDFAARPLGTSALFPLDFMSAPSLPACGEAAGRAAAGRGRRGEAEGERRSEGDASASEDSKGRAPSSGPASVSSRLWTPPFATSASWRDAVAAAEALAARRERRRQRTAAAEAAGGGRSTGSSRRKRRNMRSKSSSAVGLPPEGDGREKSEEEADGEEFSAGSTTSADDSEFNDDSWERPFLKRSCLDVSGGPLTRRSCTDVPFLLLLLVTWLAVAAALLLHILAGPSSLSRLTSGVDWQGRVCGHDPGVEEFSLLYWPAKQQPSAPLSEELPACSILPVCTKRCPQFFAARRPAGDCPADAEAAGLCSWYGGRGTALLLRSFCLFVDADGKARDHGLLSSWVRWLADLHVTWPLLLVAPAAALVCGYIFLWLLQKAAPWMIAAVVVAVEALLLLSAYSFYSGHTGFLPSPFLPPSASFGLPPDLASSSPLAATPTSLSFASPSALTSSPSSSSFSSSLNSFPSPSFVASGASVSSPPAHPFPLLTDGARASSAAAAAAASPPPPLPPSPLFPSPAAGGHVAELLSLEEGSTPAVLLSTGITRLGSLALACCCGLAAAVVAVTVLIFRKELHLSTSLLTAAALLLRETPSRFLLLLPLASAAALATHGALVVAALLHLLAVGWIPPLPLASCLPTASPWIRFPVLSWSSLLLLFFLLFVALWTAAFFNAVCRMTISYYASAWYFMPRRIPDRKELLNSKASEAARVVFRYHLGSAAFGGLILTSVQMLKFLLQWSKRRRIRRTQSFFVRILAHVGNFFASLYTPISRLSSTAYIFVALLGQPLLLAARTGIASVGRNPVVTAFVWQAGWLLQLFGKFSVALFVSWCCYAILPRLPGVKSQVSSLVAPVTFSFFISFHVASACMQFFGFAADTLLQAFLADREMSLQDGKAAAEHAPASMRVLDRYLLRSYRNSHLSL